MRKTALTARDYRTKIIGSSEKKSSGSENKRSDKEAVDVQETFWRDSNRTIIHVNIASHMNGESREITVFLIQHGRRRLIWNEYASRIIGIVEVAEFVLLLQA